MSDNSLTLIDNIFTNVSDQETIIGNILIQITDHFPQFLIIKHAGIVYKNLTYYQHDFSRLNEDNLLNDFANLDLTYLDDENSDVNAKFNRFLSDLDELAKTHAPLKKLSKRDVKFRNKPWINSKIQKMMHIRDRILRKCQKNNDQSLTDLYKKFRNRITNALKQSKDS